MPSDTDVGRNGKNIVQKVLKRILAVNLVAILILSFVLVVAIGIPYY